MDIKMISIPMDEYKKLEALRAENAKILSAEHRLSDAYLRLRRKLNAFDTPEAPTGEQVWEHTEKKLDELLEKSASQSRQIEELTAALLKVHEILRSVEQEGAK